MLPSYGLTEKAGWVRSLRPFDEDSHGNYLDWLDRFFPQRASHPEADLDMYMVRMREALGDELYGRVRDWVAGLDFERRAGAWVDSTSHPGAQWSISEPVGMAIGRFLEPVVSDALGMPAQISYCGVTRHFHGVPCVAHRDMNKGSKFLLSWPIRLDVTEPWPLHFELGPDVNSIENTDPERALLFSGHDVWHWRDLYPGQDGRLLFLRYTLCDDARMHSHEEVEHLVQAGWAELEGQAYAIPDDIIIPHCNRLATPNRDWSVVRGAFSPDEISRVLSDAQRHPYVESPPSDIRRSPIRWIDDNVAGEDASWIWKKLRRAAYSAAPVIQPDDGEMAWQYVRRGSISLAEYTPGDFFDWHTDYMPLEACTATGRGPNASMRRISVVVLLERSLTGGRLEIDGTDFDDDGIGPGDAVVFAAEKSHRVTRVEAGQRVAMTAWWG